MSGTNASISQPSALEDAVCQMALPVKVRPNAVFYDGNGGDPITNLPPRGTAITRIQALTTGLVVNQSAPDLNNFSARITGYIRPTVSGNYQFHVSSDDSGFFTIGAANTSACALSTVPTVSNAGYSGGQGASGAVSAVIALVAGAVYPFEAGYSESAGGDYVQVDWSGAVGARQLIPIGVLYDQNPTKLARRTITRVTASDGTVSYRDPYDNAVVNITAAEPLVSCHAELCASGVASAPIVPATTIPLADGVANTRVGAAGTTGRLSDAGHIHPIERLAAAAFPDVVVGGQTLVGQFLWQQLTTEETQEFGVRVHVRPTAAGAWRTITFPNIAGYQPPQVSFAGLYAPFNTGAANPWPGQHFVWGGTTFYHAPVTAMVNQDHYWMFKITYVLS